MAGKREFQRYNPSKSAPGRPWEFKEGRFGRSHRSNTLGVGASRRRMLKANPGKWFAGPVITD